MNTLPPLPTFDEFRQDCLRQGIEITPEIHDAPHPRGIIFTPHSILRALTRAAEKLTREPGTSLSTGERMLDIHRYPHTATATLASFINDSKRRTIPPGQPAYNFAPHQTSMTTCGLAEGFFARTIMSWEDMEDNTTGDIIVDTTGKPLAVRKHRSHGQGLTLMLADNFYMDKIHCPPGMFVRLRSDAEHDEKDYFNYMGPLRILPIERYIGGRSSRFAMLRMSMYGLPEAERAQAMKAAPRKELLPNMTPGEVAFTKREITTHITTLAEEAIIRATHGEIACTDLRS